MFIGYIRRLDERRFYPDDQAAPKMAAKLDSIRRRTNYALAAVLGMLVAIGVIVAINRQSLPVITPDEFRAARNRWIEAGPPDYDIAVEVTGRKAATYRVSVRQHQVVRAARNDTPLRQQRTMGTWSVPGMFSTMQSDVDNVARIAKGTATAQTPQVTMRGNFDPDLGYPAKYVRLEKTSTGGTYEVSWRVIAFESNPFRE